MEFLIDTANLEFISQYINKLPISGVTTNPSIIKKENNIDFWTHFKEVKNLTGGKRTLHIQVTTNHLEDIMKEAEYIVERLGKDVYIKIPVTIEGLNAINLLKKRGYSITATAIYTKLQGLLAMEAGADYIAPYYNRMQNLDINSDEVISIFANNIEKYNYNTKILAASFKNLMQVNNAIKYGAQAITLPKELFIDIFKMPAINKAVADFRNDWDEMYKGANIYDL